MASLVATASPQKSTTVRKALALAGLRWRNRLGSWLAPDATMRRASELFGTPMSASRVRARATDPAGADVSTVTAAGERVTVYRWGDAAREPTVLLVHGWSSFGLRFLPWVAPLRAAGYSVVAFDHIAHGRSSGRRANLPLFAAGISAAAAGCGQLAGVIAHSMGGAATSMALAGGLKAERALLIAPAADLFAAGERFGRFVGLAPYLVPRMFAHFQASLGIDVKALQPQALAPALAQPALVVHDTGDAEVPWHEGERYVRYWPQARLLSTTGLGHHRIVADPAVIDSGLRFLRGETLGERVVSSRDLPYGVA